MTKPAYKAHSRPHRGHSNDWITPPEIVTALGKFDLDPCGCPGAFYQTASKTLYPSDDGLTTRWRGRVWMNSPYGEQTKHWLRKLSEHGNGIALVPARTEVESWFWPYIWERADAVLFLRGRLYFLRPDGTRQGNAGHGSVLAAYGAANVIALRRSGIAGHLVDMTAERETA